MQLEVVIYFPQLAFRGGMKEIPSDPPPPFFDFSVPLRPADGFVDAGPHWAVGAFLVAPFVGAPIDFGALPTPITRFKSFACPPSRHGALLLEGPVSFFLRRRSFYAFLFLDSVMSVWGSDHGMCSLCWTDVNTRFKEALAVAVFLKI